MALRDGEEERVVCVTGASGYVASWLVKRLLERGYHVRATVRDIGDKVKTAHLWQLPKAQERLHLWPADLLVEGSFDAAIDGCHGVFHTATPVKHVKSDPQVEMIDPAVNGTLNVLQSCAKTSSVKRVVLTSSSSAVRLKEDLKPNEWLDESSHTSIEMCEKYKLWYAKAKTLSEKIAWDFAEKNNLDLVVVLPSFIIGPVLPSNLCLTVSDLLEFLKGESMTFPNMGRLGFVHLDDVANAHILLYEEPLAKGRFICSSVVVENIELAKFLANRYPYLSIPQEFESHGERIPYFFDSSKIEKLGIRFKTLDQMFDDLISSLKSSGHLP